MSKCLYCKAEVPDELMGYHYAGFQQPACPDVEYAFGQDDRRRDGRASAYPLPDEQAPRGRYGHAQTLRQRRDQKNAQPSRLRKPARPLQKLARAQEATTCR